jgi:adenine-specific DNA-methyltransferase
MPGLSGTTNLYVLFLASIMSRLVNGGRASILLPGDWMNSNFGQSLRAYLAQGKECARIIYFSNDSQPFDDAETTATLLLFERGKSHSEVEIVVVGADYDRENAGALALQRIEEIQNVSSHQITWANLDPSQKWDVMLRNEFVETPSDWVSLGDHAKCSRGIATGANEYFLVSEDRLLQESLPVAGNCPCIGRARDVKGLVFSDEDFKLLGSSVPKYLVDLQNASFETSQYIALGEAQGLPSRYLLSKRSPWYKLEERAPADIWVGVFGRDGIRFIWNQSGIKNLTTFHGIYLRDFYPGIEPADDFLVQALVAVLNSSRVQEKAKEFQRAYGGGLQKVEPKDVPQLLLPDVFALSQTKKHKLASALGKSDALLRKRELDWRSPIDACMNSVFN